MSTQRTPTTEAAAPSRGNDDLSPAAIDRIDRNLELAGEYLRAIFADPSLVEAIPFGASVYLIPADDPTMAAANLEGARRARLAGQTVHVHYLPSVGERTDRRLDLPEPAPR